MSRNNESNSWSPAPVKGSYGSIGSSSGSSSMVMNTRPEVWSSSSSRDIDTTVWQQRPPQPPTDKYEIRYLIVLIGYILIHFVLILAGGTVHQVTLRLCHLVEDVVPVVTQCMLITIK